MTSPSPPPPAFPLPIATTITSGDTSDTTLLDPRLTDQITIGAVALRRQDDIRYRTIDVPGGGTRELALDLLRPATGEPLPLVVYLPGGGFVTANRTNALELRSFVAESGFVVASTEYRAVADKATYVAAMTGVTNEVDEFDAGTGADGRVDAVVDSFGASDLSALGADFNDEFGAYFRDNATHFSAYLGAPGRMLPEITDIVRAADPATHVGAGTPPFLLLHGTKDFLISPSQTQHLHRALLAAGADSTRYLLDGANHGDIAFLGHPDSGLPWSSTTTMGIITAFLHRHLDGS